jgi:hypothetical protein
MFHFEFYYFENNLCLPGSLKLTQSCCNLLDYFGLNVAYMSPLAYWIVFVNIIFWESSFEINLTTVI